jgi:hypothetical protein
MGNAFRHTMRRLVGVCSVAIASLILPALARPARASYVVVELNTGFGTSAYEAGPIGLAYGASAGATLRIPALPLRFYFLGNAFARNATADGLHQGVSISAERRDVDVYASERTVLPVWGPLRLYGEVGLGERFTKETIRRGADLGPLTASGNELLVVLALGLELRLTDMFSTAIRGELMPITSDLDLAGYAAELQPRAARTALMAQLGVHF